MPLDQEHAGAVVLRDSTWEVCETFMTEWRGCGGHGMGEAEWVTCARSGIGIWVDEMDI